MEGLIFGILRYIQSIIRTFQGNRKKVRVSGSSSYSEFEANNRK